jgi:hypothetical protein
MSAFFCPSFTEARLPILAPNVTTSLHIGLERQLGQLVRLVHDLLNIARVTSGQIALQKERVALQEILQSAVEASEPLRMTTKNSLTLKLPAEPLHLEADPTRRPNPPGKSQSLNRHSWHLNQGEADIGTSIPSRN